jgi:sigma-B regulation protein RsbU (phosphoserine phosphatase)
MLLARPALQRIVVNNVSDSQQTRRAFLLDFSLCIAAGFLVSLHNSIILDIPPLNLLSLLIGCVIAGFFIGLDSALSQERQVILATMKSGTSVALQHSFYPLTRRFTLIAVTTSFFVSLVMILVFTRDVEWLTTTVHTTQSMHAAQLSVIFEIVFIMAVLVVLVVNLIFSYSRNLKLLFDNETKVLEQVQKGDLTGKVPVATHDEFGVIASHTNHMIDGLRHRFELISSLKLAEEVQQNLLPDTSPYCENFDISGTSLYCDQTGGDYFDYFRLPQGKLGVVVADACGHGVGAALLMTSVRAFITSATARYKSPASLMDEINQHITRDCSKTSRFTSMFFLELSNNDRSITWVRAGHEPALLYKSASSEFIKLEGPGLVLGIDFDHIYQNSTYSDLEPGDIIVIGTDGIRETRDPNGSFFGEERLTTIIRKMNGRKARQIEKKIVQEVEKFRGEQPQDDDLTLVVIRVTSPEEHRTVKP